MAYPKRKRYTTRRRVRRKTRGRKIARVSTVKRMISKNIEKKWFNGAATGQLVDYAAPLLLSLNKMAKGTARNQRIGNRIKATHLECGFVVAAGGQMSRTRVMLFWDTQTNSATIPALGQLFADGTLTSTNVISPLSPDLFPARFKLIYDRVVQTGIEGGATNVNEEVQWKKKFRLSKYVQYNDGDTGSISDIVKNALYYFATSDETSSGQPSISLNFVFRYQDA